MACVHLNVGDRDTRIFQTADDFIVGAFSAQEFLQLYQQNSYTIRTKYTAVLTTVRSGNWYSGARLRLVGWVTQGDDCARVCPTPDPTSAIPVSSECRASSYATGREAGGWCRRCRLTVVTRAISLGIRVGCSRGEVWGWGGVCGDEWGATV